MKNRSISLALAIQSIFLSTFCAVPGIYAQSIGIGAGIAVSNDKIAQVTADLASQGWSGVAENAGVGYYAELRGRTGGQLALIGSIGYNHFSETPSQYLNGNNQPVELMTAQTIIPITLGADMRLSTGFLVPYITLEASYNQYYRMFTQGSGDFSGAVEFESSGESRFGAAVGAGLSMDLKFAELAVGGRLHLPNLINADEGESEVYYMQLGAMLYFGL